MFDLERYARIAGIVSTAVAVISLAVTANSIRGDLRASAIREWQEVTVYSIVAQSGSTGVSMDEVRGRFQAAAIDFGDEVPNKEISTQSLRRTLLSLTAKRAVAMRADGAYVVMMDGGVPGMSEQLQTAVRMQGVGNALITLIAAAPGKYTLPEAKNLLIPRFKFTDEEFTVLTTNMTNMNLLRYDTTVHLVPVTGAPLFLPMPPIGR
jgi:hypothetical protein